MYDERYDRLIADHYDGTYTQLRDPSGDAGFYAELAAQTGGPVLELGCGTGRVLLPIAATGVDCVGLDASPAMLDVLRAKSPPPDLALVEGTLERFSLDRRFALIFSAFRVVQHLATVDQQLAWLARVHEHLADDGLLAFDVFDPDLARMAVAEEPEVHDATFADGDDEVRRYVSVVRDHPAQVMELTMRFERLRDGAVVDSSSTQLSMRWFYRFELQHLLARAGFEVVDVFGGFDRRPVGSGNLVFVARKARSDR